MATGKPEVLCVDDEAQVVEGLQATLRRHFSVTTALSGNEGLEAMRATHFDVVLSDMRMPGMNGAQFLKRARETAADTVRMLLTGYSDVESAIAAINEGHVFRFLTKPCPPDVLIPALHDGVEQHRLLVAERELLEKTLRGCVQALTEVLALASPRAFGRATRVRKLATSIAERMSYQPIWEIEVAAMLAQLGSISLPDVVASKLFSGQVLTPEEQVMVAHTPEVAAKLLEGIPRLERIREIVANSQRPDVLRGDEPPSLGARILRVVTDYDRFEMKGFSKADACATTRARAGSSDREVAETLSEIIGGVQKGRVIEELSLSGLRVGMVLESDVYTKNGILLVAKGHEVTVSLLTRLRNVASTQPVQEPIVAVREERG